ncbi:MAG: DUF5615 family PIN-like protein [Chloroflexi bacterium]|nr:DUF5615 family PIN-like protein [Chloroflexota bacterium]
MKIYISFYFDEDIEVSIAAMIASEKYDVLTARDAGMLTKSDREQLEFAIREERTIVTHNREHFKELHSEYLREGNKHYGIVILIRRNSFREMANRLLELLGDTMADEMENQLRFV